MTDLAAEVREASFDTTYWRNRAKTAKRIAAELGEDEPSPVEGMLAACDTVDALSARLAQAEQERGEALKQRDYDYARFSEAKRGVIDGSQSVIAERDRAERAEARLREYEEALKRAVYLAEHLFQMVPREVWRDSGGDDGQGHYEGDYRAEKLRDELAALASKAGTDG